MITGGGGGQSKVHRYLFLTTVRSNEYTILYLFIRNPSTSILDTNQCLATNSVYQASVLELIYIYI